MKTFRVLSYLFYISCIGLFVWNIIRACLYGVDAITAIAGYSCAIIWCFISWFLYVSVIKTQERNDRLIQSTIKLYLLSRLMTEKDEDEE